ATLVRTTQIPDDSSALVVGLAGSSPSVDRLLKEHDISLAAVPEALCIRKLHWKNRSVTLIAGHDWRGLSYALLDVARGIELAPAGNLVSDAVTEALESPLLRVRAVSI